MQNYDNSGMKEVCYAAGVWFQLIAYLTVTVIKARAGTVAVAYRYQSLASQYARAIVA